MTEVKAHKDIYNYSVLLNEVCHLYNDRREETLFSLDFQRRLKWMVVGLMNASFGDLEKYRNAYCVSNCLPGHSIRTALLAICLAKESGIEASEVYRIGLGGMLHDIGKLFIPRKIIDKPCKLSVSEFEVIKEHSLLGFEILKNQNWLPEESLEIVLNHHEKMNGSGYPNQLTAHQIPFYARLVGVADVFDAVTSKRNYRDALGYQEALGIIQKETPNLLDENIVQVLNEMVEKYTCFKMSDSPELKVRDYGQIAI